MRLPSLILFSTLVLAVTETSVHAGALFLPSLPVRIAQSDCVIVGIVAAIEEKPVLVPVSPGSTDKIPYQIAVVKIEHAFLGARGLTTLRVGMFPRNRIGRGLVPAQLVKGQEACLLLHAHPQEAFYTVDSNFDVIDKTSKTFTKDMTSVRVYSQILNEPIKALHARSAHDRALAAALLVLRCTTPRFGEKAPRKVPLDATESKLILQALAEGDWKNNSGLDPFLTPQHIFGLLDNKTGWTAPADAAQFPLKAQRWLKENAGSYRISRTVREAQSK